MHGAGALRLAPFFWMRLVRQSFGKVNLLLNILGRRSDGFHELETVLLPVAVFDEIAGERAVTGIRLTCSLPGLRTDSGNLVVRAARAYLDRAGIGDGVRLHLDKRLPLEAGLGGGSSNAAATLLLLNELFEERLNSDELQGLAAGLGSDVPFFLEPGPALATGRGERIERLKPFAALRGTWLLLVHPGFGVSTPWAYRELARHPGALAGEPGRARALVKLLQGTDARAAGKAFYNGLEVPVLAKYPLLGLLQEELRDLHCWGVLMSGSGSTTFALWGDEASARLAESAVRKRFGAAGWTTVVAAEDQE